MKNAHKLFALLFLTLLSFSCTPQSLADEPVAETEDIFATGGDSSSELDNDKDGE